MAGGILTLIRRLLIGEPAPPRLEQGQTDNRHITIFGPTEEIPPVLPNSHARLVFAVDATASRSAAWEAAKELTDALFQALPGTLDVALAVHGGEQGPYFYAVRLGCTQAPRPGGEHKVQGGRNPTARHP